MKKIINESSFERCMNWPNVQCLKDDIILADNLIKAHIPEGPFRMNFIYVGLCEKGSASYTLDTQQNDITPGDLIIVTERHVVDQFTISADILGPSILISPRFFQETIQNTRDISSLLLFTRTHPVVKLTEKESETFKEYFEVIKKKIATGNNHYLKPLIRALILALFYDLNNAIYRLQNNSNQHMTRADDIFTKFIKLVEANSHQQRRVGWYAQQLCITPKYLSETVKVVSRHTPNEWIDRYVTNEARLRLKNTTSSIKEIAEQMNFPNQSFFGKYFREHVGVSPSAYRKS
ncbi:MAG: helix-turn-helix domain-containing protein [Prevotella sp.]|nr:helix-turn-helix domain-containing protein [Prevotella sp.]